MFLSIVVVAVGNHADAKNSKGLTKINFTISILVSRFSCLLFIYSLFKDSIEIERGNILLFKKPPKYYPYPLKQYLSDIETHNYTHYDTANGSVGNTYKVKCYYNAKYYDTTRSRLVDFQCPEDALKKGSCILHEDDVSKSKENELDNTLNEKINKLIDVGQEIFCLGYNIPFV